MPEGAGRCLREELESQQSDLHWSPVWCARHWWLLLRTARAHCSCKAPGGGRATQRGPYTPPGPSQGRHEGSTEFRCTASLGEDSGHQSKERKGSDVSSLPGGSPDPGRPGAPRGQGPGHSRVCALLRDEVDPKGQRAWERVQRSTWMVPKSQEVNISIYKQLLFPWGWRWGPGNLTFYVFLCPCAFRMEQQTTGQ